MKRLLLAGLGLFALATAPALAADLPARVPGKAPAYTPAYSWTGFYAGINGGGAWGRSNWTDVTTGASSGNFSVNGGLVGGTLGYNWQASAIVFGLETDLDWTSIRGTNSTGCVGAVCRTSNSWLGTFRGRLGYAMGTVLPYITGGLAYGNLKISDGAGNEASATRAGWTVGGGVEFAISGPWTVKAEYLYADFGKTRCDTNCSGGNPFDVKFNTHIVRAGLNYRFGM